MNIMRIKRIGKMATAAIIAFIAVVVFINPQKASASQGGAVTVTATSNYVLDDSHNVDISITAYVEYAYDEGAYGWLIHIIAINRHTMQSRLFLTILTSSIRLHLTHNLFRCNLLQSYSTAANLRFIQNG